MRTHCKRGHRYDEANTYIDRRGARNCRACARISRRKWQEANFESPEERRERERVWREKNRERIRARNRAAGGLAIKHHLEERNKIVAWLRALDDGSGDINRFLPSTLAQWIEEGAHTL